MDLLNWIWKEIIFIITENVFRNLFLFYFFKNGFYFVRTDFIVFIHLACHFLSEENKYAFY